ncbi:hypothetical protein [Caproiciproducens sp. MSJ-32]|uniref:hypothetical protein n=1 Tax=Caproiciproducens sp. MSJ-32 TaxID=2841527 RepID=UPI001C11AA90|nr:hypothetical protein [Caproiciproducens sp. MSJ-32]MBU5454553.1 hypothetical protein [Caproiciproducens sp. MSJ-32]
MEMINMLLQGLMGSGMPNMNGGIPNMAFGNQMSGQAGGNPLFNMLLSSMIGGNQMSGNQMNGNQMGGNSMNENLNLGNLMGSLMGNGQMGNNPMQNNPMAGQNMMNNPLSFLMNGMGGMNGGNLLSSLGPLINMFMGGMNTPNNQQNKKSSSKRKSATVDMDKLMSMLTSSGIDYTNTNNSVNNDLRSLAMYLNAMNNGKRK